MPADKDKTRFTLADVRKPMVRDKDNAMPKVKPPTTVQLEHPRLAPPGMSGTKTGTKRYTLSFSFQVERQLNVSPGQKDVAKKAFQPIAKTPPGKDIDHSR